VTIATFLLITLFLLPEGTYGSGSRIALWRNLGSIQ